MFCRYSNIDNKCRIFNVSLGWVNTALVEHNENFLDPYEAALIMTNLMEEQNYVVPEIVISNKQLPRDEIDLVVNQAADYMVKSITHSNRLANADK